jgi:hypothetical protein
MKAFPSIDWDSQIESKNNQLTPISSGMDLRDYFAAKAMEAIIQKADDRSTVIGEVELWVGSYAYKVADAMIEARKK